MEQCPGCSDLLPALGAHDESLGKQRGSKRQVLAARAPFAPGALLLLKSS